MYLYIYIINYVYIYIYIWDPSIWNTHGFVFPSALAFQVFQVGAVQQRKVHLNVEGVTSTTRSKFGGRMAKRKAWDGEI